MAGPGWTCVADWIDSGDHAVDAFNTVFVPGYGFFGLSRRHPRRVAG